MANTGSPGRHSDWKRRERDAEVMEKVAHKYGCAEKAEKGALEKTIVAAAKHGSAEEAEKNEKKLRFVYESGQAWQCV